MLARIACQQVRVRRISSRRDKAARDVDVGPKSSRRTCVLLVCDIYADRNAYNLTVDLHRLAAITRYESDFFALVQISLQICNDTKARDEAQRSNM